ncbi:GFA family protein [Haliea sp. E17]|uniref:GFA family protein n=1 Tax=Haliea sp. E17 TaxID=3401576 RepID=UPI003AAB88CE
MTQPSGSCLCGAVAFAIEGEFKDFFLCHCSHCRKGSGSAHAANLFAPNARLRWLRGADSVANFQLPGTRHVRAFCRHCGSALPNEALAEGLVMVPAGCLDTPLTLRPSAHIFTASRAGWDSALEQVPAVPGSPAMPGNQAG